VPSFKKKFKRNLRILPGMEAHSLLQRMESQEKATKIKETRSIYD
jgi:hypothetical protein